MEGVAEEKIGVGDFGSFAEFVEKEGLGKVVPDQCEVTYVNDLDSGEGWNDFGDVAAVVTVWQSRFNDDFLPSPEETRFKTSFVIQGEREEPAGRLHVAVEPRYRLPRLDRLLRLSLTARGAPLGAGLDGVRGPVVRPEHDQRDLRRGGTVAPPVLRGVRRP